MDLLLAAGNSHSVPAAPPHLMSLTVDYGHTDWATGFVRVIKEAGIAKDRPDKGYNLEQFKRHDKRFGSDGWLLADCESCRGGTRSSC